MFPLPLLTKLNLQTDKTEEVRRLGMGQLLEDLSRKMQHKVVYGSQDPLKILVHSTHDTTIAGLCSTLDVFDDRSVLVFGIAMVTVDAHNTIFFKRWPAFTASITFELYKKTESPNQSPYPQAFSSHFGTSPAYRQHCSFHFPLSTLFIVLNLLCTRCSNAISK